MLGQFLVIVIVISVIIKRWQNRRLVKLHEQLKSDAPSWPIIGHCYYFLGNCEVHLNGFNKFGREAIEKDGIVSFWIGNYLYISIADPAIAEVVLKTCLEKGDIMRFIRFVIDNGSVFAPVSIWRPRRKIMAPTFSPKNLTRFLSTFAEQSAVMAQQLRSASGAGPFSVWKYLATYTMDSVCETTLGVQCQAQRNPEHPFLKHFDEGTGLIAERIVSPWLHNDLAYRFTASCKILTRVRNFLQGFVHQIIKEKRKVLKEEKRNIESSYGKDANKDALKTFLELLIEASGGERGYTDQELIEETLVLLVAGTDTSAAGAGFVLQMLARHQDVQDKVYEELREIYGDSKAKVTAEDLPALKYMDAVIRESLRLYPPVPLIVRNVEEDVTLPSGHTLVKDCLALVNIWALHRNPRYWGPDAEVFRPERFLNPDFKHPAQFMPFSYGPRNCLGYQYAMMSMKTMLATLLRYYRVLPATAIASSDQPPLRLKFEIMLKDVDNFTIQIEPRTNKQC